MVAADSSKAVSKPRSIVETNLAAALLAAQEAGSSRFTAVKAVSAEAVTAATTEALGIFHCNQRLSRQQRLATVAECFVRESLTIVAMQYLGARNHCHGVCARMPTSQLTVPLRRRLTKRSFADPRNSAQSKVNQNYFNVGWGGVRSSTLPYALEPTTGSLEYADPDTVAPLSLCPMGADDPKDLHHSSMGGYTTFARGEGGHGGDGLLVRSILPAAPPLPCVKNGKMQESCTQNEIDAGARRLELLVRPGETPQCQQTGFRKNGLFLLACDFHDKGFPQLSPVKSYFSADPCRPWAKLGFRNMRTGKVLQIEVLKHWSGSSDSRKLYFMIAATSASNAANKVNNMFENTGYSQKLSIELVVLPEATDAPSDYDPDEVGSFTFVYGKGQQNDAGGTSRRRIAGTQQGPGLRDYTVFTINWLVPSAVSATTYPDHPRSLLTRVLFSFSGPGKPVAGGEPRSRRGRRTSTGVTCSMANWGRRKLLLRAWWTSTMSI